MSKTPLYWNKAKKYLSKKDKVISKLIRNYQSPSETILTSRKDIFFSLCKSIIGQQISVSAANSVFKKFKKKCKNKITANIVNVVKLYIKFESELSKPNPIPVFQTKIIFIKII